MRVLGLKLCRWKEWALVVRTEGRSLSMWGRVAMAWSMFSHALRMRSTSRREWRCKMRCCYRCPIYDTMLRRCRPYDGAPHGCGCYTPFLALTTDHCYADEYLPHDGIGWQSALIKYILKYRLTRSGKKR